MLEIILLCTVLNSVPEQLENKNKNNIQTELNKIQLSGYVQGRFEWHEDSLDGVNSLGKPITTTQFLVRRGRLKAVYSGELMEGVIQIDATGSGVSLKDAEATFIEPWSGLNLRFTVGQFKYPFGQEILQSSSVREMPERSRIIKTLFPGERDRGLRFQIKNSFFNLQSAVVNGNGTQDSLYGANDQNKFKDVVGRLGFDFKYVILGISGYWGQGLVSKLGDNSEYTKARVGADLSINTSVHVLGNLTLKAEVVRGTDFQSNPFGFSIIGVQNIGNSFALFSRFDKYDADLGKKNNSIDTIGGGFHYLFSNNLKGTAVYEHPISEISDLRDDLTTLQLQGMF